MANGETSRTVKCGECGKILPKEWASKSDDERLPCPRCGSMKMHVSLTLRDSLPVGATIVPRPSREEDLARWVVDRPMQHGLAIATRAALRCLWFPIWEPRYAGELSLVGLRLCALGVLAAHEGGEQPRMPSRQLINAANQKLWHRSQAGKLWRDLSRAFTSIRREPTDFADAVVDVARHVAAITSILADPKDSWTEIEADVQAISDLPTDALMETELFGPGVSRFILDEVQSSNRRYREHGLAFLADWYEAILRGRVDIELLRAIVGIPHEDWAKGAEHVGDLIVAFKVSRKLHDATPLAEEIVFDDSSGKLRANPVQMLPPHLYDTGLEKLRDAVDDARSAATRDPNSYTALHPTLEMLDRTLTKYRSNPQRVHDDQLLAIRKIERLVIDSLVPNDEEIASLLQVLDSNAVDIRAAIPAVADAVQKRTDIRFRELDAAGRQSIHSAVEAVVSNSEESLAQEMQEDERATFMPERSPSDVESPYRLAGRLAAVARTLHSLEQIIDFTRRQGRLVSTFSHEFMQILGKFIGL